MTTWSNPARVLCWTYLVVLCNALAVTFSLPGLGIDHSYLSEYFQNKSKHFKLLQVVPEDKRLFELLPRLVRQPRAILGAPHRICWVASLTRPGKTVFYSSCLATAAKEVRGAFKKIEISKSGRLLLFLVESSWRVSPRSKGGLLGWSGAQARWSRYISRWCTDSSRCQWLQQCLIASLFVRPSPQSFFPTGSACGIFSNEGTFIM